MQPIFVALLFTLSSQTQTLQTQNPYFEIIGKEGYSTIIQDKHTGWFLVEKEGKWGYIDTQGEIVVEPRYQNACYFHENLASVKRNGKWTWINKSGEEIMQPVFDNVSIFKNNVAIAEFNGKWGWINSNGEVAVPLIYDWVTDFRNDGLAAVKLNNKWGWINRNGSVVIPIQYDAIDGYEEGLVRVKKDNFTFYIDKKGRCMEDCYADNAPKYGTP